MTWMVVVSTSPPFAVEVVAAVLFAPATVWPFTAPSLLLLAGASFRTASFGVDTGSSFRLFRAFGAPARPAFSLFRFSIFGDLQKCRGQGKMQKGHLQQTRNFEEILPRLARMRHSTNLIGAGGERCNSAPLLLSRLLRPPKVDPIRVSPAHIPSTHTTPTPRNPSRWRHSLETDVGHRSSVLICPSTVFVMRFPGRKRTRSRK